MLSDTFYTWDFLEFRYCHILQVPTHLSVLCQVQSTTRRLLHCSWVVPRLRQLFTGLSPSQVQSQATPYGIWGGHVGTGTGFSLSASVSTSQHYFTSAPYPFIHLSLMFYNLNNLCVSLNNTEKDTSFWVVLDGSSACYTVLDWYGLKKKEQFEILTEMSKTRGLCVALILLVLLS